MTGDGRSRWTAIAPGRVNLIGEHTDYNGLPVLPIAIQRGIRIEFRVLDEPVVRLDSPASRFDPFEFRLKRPIAAADQGHWSNYVRAAARGLIEHGLPLRRGIEGTVTGDVPIAAGLSSSSALVVASALALLKASGVESISRLELAALMARAERFVGLEGGGMDQAACLHGEAGHALRIEFEPLRVTKVAVPEGWRWVVASSLARAEKSAGAREAYNERARQCREALEAVKQGGERFRGKSRDIRMFGRDAGDRFRGKSRDARMFAWDARERFRGKRRDARMAGRDARVEQAPATYRGLVAGGGLGELIEGAREVLSPVLLRRFRHVVTEGRRVAQAEAAMREGDLGRFGELMVASHESLRRDYEVSTSALDEIVAIALEAGAAGARLTGAGFGGCAVALCDDRTVGAVMEALAARFYAPRLDGPPGRDVIFAARPSGGAGVNYPC